MVSRFQQLQSLLILQIHNPYAARLEYSNRFVSLSGRTEICPVGDSWMLATYATEAETEFLPAYFLFSVDCVPR